MLKETINRRITNGLVGAMQLDDLDTNYSGARIQVTDLVRLAQARGMRYIGFHHEQSAGNTRCQGIGGSNV